MIRIGLDPSAFKKGSDQLAEFESDLIRDRQRAAQKLSEVDARAVDAQRKSLAGNEQLSYSEKRLLRDRQRAAREVERAEAKVQAARDQAARAAFVVGTAAVAMTAVAVKKYADFDEAMSGVASTGEDARNNIAALREQAIKLGADTKYSASEAANGIEELAKAGVEAKDILGGGLQGALSLAAAGELEVAQAAEITAKTMNQFSLTGADATRISDVLAASAGKAAGEVSDFGNAMEYVGPIASSLGVSLEETSGTLALLAQNGLLADKAGTGLRGVLMSMAAPTKAAKKVMDEYNIAAYDTEGKFIGISALAGELQTKLGSLGDEERNAALKRMFGNAQLTAAQILYRDGAREVDTWTKAVSEQGYAATTAATKMDNLKGDIEMLSGSLDTAFIKSGSGANNMLRKLVQGAEYVVDAIGKIPEPVMGAVTSIVGAGGLAILGVAGMYKLVKAIGSVRATLASLSISFKTAGIAAGAIGGGLAAATIGLSAWISHQAEAKQKSEELRGSLDQTTAAITEQTKALMYDKIVDSSGYERITILARQLGLTMTDVVALAVGETTEATQALNAEMDVSRRQLEEWSTRADQGGEAASALRQPLTQYGELLEWIEGPSEDLSEEQEALREKIAAVGAASEDSADATGKSASALESYRAATKASTDASEEFSEALKEQLDLQREAAGIVLDQRSAERAYEAAVDDARATMKDYKKSLIEKQEEQTKAKLGVKELSDAQRDAARDAAEAEYKAALKSGAALDVTTEAGRKNQDALDGIAQSAWKKIEADRAAGESQEQLAVTAGIARDALIEQARKFGMTKREANAYADELGLIPEDVRSSVTLETNDAQAKLDWFNNQLDRLGGRKVTPKVTIEGKQVVDFAELGKKADGGPIEGGVKGKDSVPILAMPGEHMWTTSETQAVGGHRKMYVLRSMARSGMLSGLLDGYASGGEVGEAKAKRDAARTAASKAAKAVKQAETASTKASRKSRDTPAKDKAAKTAAKLAADKARDELKDAREAKKRADKNLREANKALEDARKQRAQDRSDARERREIAGELAISVRRGEIGESISSGGGLSQVDELRSQSANSAISKAGRKKLGALADRMETRITNFNARMEKATDAASQMESAFSSVSSSIRSESKLGDLLGQTTQTGFAVPVTAQAMRTHARGAKDRARAFAGKLKALADAGAPPALIQEVASYGTVDGAHMADELLRDKAAFNEMKVLYGTGPDSISYWSDQAGQAVTESMGAGGYAAAQALVESLTAEAAGIGAVIATGIADALGYKVNAKTGKATKKTTKTTTKKLAKKRALGGDAPAGQPLLVGEDGAELFVPGVSGRIVTAPETRRTLSQVTSEASPYALGHRQLSAQSEMQMFASALERLPLTVVVDNQIGERAYARFYVRGKLAAVKQGAAIEGKSVVL